MFEIRFPSAVLSFFEGFIKISVGFSQARIFFRNFMWSPSKSVGGLHQEQQSLPEDILVEGMSDEFTSVEAGR